MPDEPIKVLIVLASNSRRGAEIQGVTLGEELSARGLRTTVLALTSGSAAQTLHVPTLGSTPLGRRTLLGLRRAAMGHDLVIAYGSSTLPACAVALVGTDVPWVYRSIGDPAEWSTGAFQRLRTRLLLRRASLVVALWPEARQWFVQKYGVSDDRVIVISNARSPHTFRPPSSVERNAARKQLGLDLNSLVVGVIGSLSSEKRVDLAIAAIAEIDEVVALIVGDGPERHRLESISEVRLSDRAIFTGVLEDVRPVYWAIDALLLTSRTEGMPGVIIEAAMSGVPVVATAVGGVSAMFEHGVAGCLVISDSKPALASALSDVLAAPVHPHVAPAFSWDVVAHRWLTALANLRGELIDWMDFDSGSDR